MYKKNDSFVWDLLSINCPEIATQYKIFYGPSYFFFGKEKLPYRWSTVFNVLYALTDSAGDPAHLCKAPEYLSGYCPQQESLDVTPWDLSL